MILSIPDRVMRLLLPSIYCLMIIISVAVMCLGIMANNDFHTRHDHVESAMRNAALADGGVTIFVACLDIIIGICGIAGVLMKIRALSLVNTALLISSIMINLLLFCICFFSVTLTEDNKLPFEFSEKSFRTNYGNYSSHDGGNFTLKVDMYQDAYACCGWTGIDGKNLFLKTPWHIEINQNVTGNPRTLPDSCCITPDDESCRTTQDVKQARKSGLVYEKDCMDQVVHNVNGPIWNTIFLILTSIVIKIACGVFTMLFVTQASPV